jgi:hypothetical protein
MNQIDKQRETFSQLCLGISDDLKERGGLDVHRSEVTRRVEACRSNPVFLVELDSRHDRAR